MSRRLAILSCGLAASLSLSASPAAAFCRSTTCSKSCPRDEDGCKESGKKLYWPGACVGFSLQRDGSVNLPIDLARPAIEAGFYAWSDVDCGGGATTSLAFAALADVSCRVAEYAPDEPNANVILFRDNQWTYRGADNTLAKTTVSYDIETGEILDADIEINHAYNEFTVGDDNVVYDLQSVVTHEIGHFIGLDHSSDPRATMFAGYSMGSTELRTIEADDIAAICAAYPPGRRGMCEPTPPDGLADACSGDDGSSSLSGAGCALSPAPRSGTRAATLLGALSLGLLFRAARRKASQSHP